MKRVFSLHDHTSIALSELHPHWEYLFFKKIDSTNNYAKNNVEKFTPPTLIIAEHQTHGRGRGENTWDDQGHGHQLLSTWITALKAKQPDPRWTMALGYFVYANLQSTWTDLEFSIKAPNDIYLNDKKLGGLLVETTNFENYVYLFLGLGLNVFGRPSGLHSSATSLVEHLHSLDQKDWQRFARAMAVNMAEFEKFLSNPKWLKEISQGLIMALNRNVHHKSNPVREISDDGSLKLDRGHMNWLEL